MLILSCFVLLPLLGSSIPPPRRDGLEQEHWNHLTIRRLIEQRIHKRNNQYRKQDDTEHGVALEREWGGTSKDKLDEMGRKECATTSCRHGQCVFAGCNNPTSCNGGKCTFIDCERPSCRGGKCRFVGCHHPTCSGGLCRFELTNTTLGAGYCKGGSCTIDGIVARNDMDKWLAE